MQLRKNDNRIDRADGFTLIELITVIVIVGILSYLAVANMGGTQAKLQYETLAQKIATDVRYAKQLAFATGTGTRVYIDQTNNRYYLKWENGTYIPNPFGGGDFIIQLGRGDFQAVQITGTSFSGGRLDFNSRGAPLNSGVSFSGTLNLVTLNNSKKVVVTANTGLVKVENY